VPSHPSSTVQANRAAAGHASAGVTERAGTIGVAIEGWANAQGDAPALVSLPSGKITFSQLQSSISLFAAQLANAGIGREHRVGLPVPAGAAGGRLVVALASNTTLVPMNPALTPDETIGFAKESGLDAIVIPAWVQTPARPALLAQGTTTFEAVLSPDGALALQLLTLAHGKPAPLLPPRESDVALLLRSSGTTGAPKLIPVTHRNLLAMAERLGSPLWFNLTARDRAACVLPLHYAAGLKTSLFVPLILGASVAFPPTGHAVDLPRWLDALKPTYLSVAPGSLNGMLDRLKASAHDFDGSSLRFVMCAAAYLPEDVRVTAEAALRVPVLEFYGLSEAGIMAANPVPPGRAKPGTVGLPAPGELLVVDHERQPVAQGAVGQIMISGPTVTPGYVAIDPSSAGEFKDGWLLTGDLGRLDEDGYLTIVGRVKEVINRGGEKVFPYEIEKAILQHPAVLEAAAFGVPHPRLGENVAAAAVLKPGSSISEQDLKEFLATRLAGFKLPRRLCLVESLPRGATGKILRRSLTDAYAAARRQMAEPDGLLELELLEIWKRLLRTDDIGIDDDFFEMGGDSLLAAEMLLEVERLSGKPYPQSGLSALTIRRMADVVASGLATEHDVITQVKQGSGIPLFFCHGDYATRGIYAHRLAALLPDDQPVYLLHGQDDRLAGSSMEAIALGHLQQVLRVAGAGSPVIVAGYCNGGLAAWHLAHLLRTRGVEVVELLLIETLSLNARPEFRRLPGLFQAAGSLLPGKPGRFLREDAMRALWILRRRGLVDFTRRLSRIGRRRFRSALRKELPPAPRRDASDRAAKMYYRLMSRYVPPPLDLEVTCFIAEEGSHFDTDPAPWRGLATRVNEVSMPGTHYSAMVSERPVLAKLLGEVLERAAARCSHPGGLRDQPGPDHCVEAGVAAVADSSL
jgi:oxalate---CoA ligase